MRQAKPYKAKNPHTFARAALRGASRRWPAGNEALRRARVSRGKYQCNICKGIFRVKEVERDHIFPVVEIDSEYSDFNKYITRLYCTPEEIQILCVSCHSTKTDAENAMRKFYKAQNKKKK